MRWALLVLVCACRNAPKTEPPVPPPLPSVEEVCVKAVDLTFADMDVAPTKEERDAYRGKCLEEVDKERTQEPTVYACEAPCVMAAQAYGDLQVCGERCKKHD